VDLQTKIRIPQAKNRLDYSSKSLCLGSCFAGHIGDKLRYYKFQHTVNPFGVLFHPFAIETLIQRAIQGKFYSKDEFFTDRGLWHHYELHSSLSHPDKNALLDTANARLTETKELLREATHIFITLGTAFTYQYKPTGKLVANCHKVAQQNFTKILQSSTDITQSLTRIKDLIRLLNPQAQLVFTVSPVRHLKDGFIENQRSKSHLISAVHEYLDQHKADHYFPSYEVLLDELRDYRFYGHDMMHPSALAIDYIWDKFKATWIEESAFTTMEKVQRIQQGLAHRPFQENSDNHQVFLANLAAKIDEIQQQHPFIEF